MDTLQIQDSFQPYYADRPARLETASSKEVLGDKRAAGHSETLVRLERCRARLAQAIAADAARH